MSQLELFPVYNLSEQLQDHMTEGGILCLDLSFFSELKSLVYMTALAVPSEMCVTYLGAGSVGFSSELEE